MNAILKALIVDDEPLARELLASLLVEHGNVEVIGMAGGVAEARVLLAMQRPDVVFLDMEMPGGSGLELRPHLPAAAHTVFVTAHEDRALQAFDFGARDYLVKPVDLPRLRLAILRVMKMPPPVSEKSANAMVSKVETDRKIQWISVPEILWIEAHQNYTRVCLAGDAPALLVGRSMTEWQSELPDDEFTRLSRSIIVNVGRIRTVCWESRDATFVQFLRSGQTLELGRTAALRLKERLRSAR